MPKCTMKLAAQQLCCATCVAVHDPRNILVSQQDGSLKAKLADFGLAKYFADAGLSRFSGENEIKGTLETVRPRFSGMWTMPLQSWCRF